MKGLARSLAFTDTTSKSFQSSHYSLAILQVEAPHIAFPKVSGNETVFVYFSGGIWLKLNGYCIKISVLLVNCSFPIPSNSGSRHFGGFVWFLLFLF